MGESSQTLHLTRTQENLHYHVRTGSELETEKKLWIKGKIFKIKNILYYYAPKRIAAKWREWGPTGEREGKPQRLDGKEIQRGLGWRKAG